MVNKKVNRLNPLQSMKSQEEQTLNNFNSVSGYCYFLLFRTCFLRPSSILSLLIILLPYILFFISSLISIKFSHESLSLEFLFAVQPLFFSSQ